MATLKDGRVRRAQNSEEDEKRARRKAVIKYATEVIEQYEFDHPDMVIIDEQTDDAEADTRGLLGLEESYHE